MWPLISLDTSAFYSISPSDKIGSWMPRLPYWSIFGGISAMTSEHYEKLNGFSNDYWGWGGEDDDVSTRYALRRATKIGSHHYES